MKRKKFTPAVESMGPRVVPSTDVLGTTSVLTVDTATYGDPPPPPPDSYPTLPTSGPSGPA